MGEECETKPAGFGALSNTAQEMLPCPLDQEIQEWTANSGPKAAKKKEAGFWYRLFNH